MSGVEGFMYPNEVGSQWSVLIVLYPYITGLVAGAFILASLERVFRVQAVKPTYRLALLTALAFLLVAPLPLQLHLGHPERSPEMYFTPHSTSAMAMFGYVYLWYLMAVLAFEIWLDYRRDIVLLSQKSKGLLRLIYKIMTLGSSNISERSLHIDERVGWIRHAGRHSFRFPAARLRRIHLRIHQGQSHGGTRRSCLLSLSFRPWFRASPASWCIYMAATKMRGKSHRHALRRHHCDVLVLHLHHRLQP